MDRRTSRGIAWRCQKTPRSPIRVLSASHPTTFRFSVWGLLSWVWPLAGHPSGSWAVGFHELSGFSRKFQLWLDAEEFFLKGGVGDDLGSR